MTTRSGKKRWLTVLAIASCQIWAYGADVDFNSYTSSSDNDLVNRFNIPDTLTQIPSGGITGGAVQASGLASTPMYTTSFNPIGGLTTSVFMRYDNVNSGFPSSGGFSVRAGFNGISSQGLDIFSPTAYFWGEFSNDGMLVIWSRGSGNGNGFNAVGTTLAPALGSWIKLTFSENYLGGDQFMLSTTLENYGLTGMESPALLSSGSVMVPNALAAADSSVYAGFGGYYHVSHFDNFSVVPEPNQIQLMSLGGIVLFLLKNKRQIFREHKTSVK
jgi:hypothetical protein